MFTDGPVTPQRIEILLEVVRHSTRRLGISRDALLSLVHPEGLPEHDAKYGTAKEVLTAARELGLVDVNNDVVKLTEEIRALPNLSARDLLIPALEQRVLRQWDIELYLAPYYGFLLVLGADACTLNSEAGANRYNDRVYPNGRPNNPLNKDKVRGLRRWYLYLGLGWRDGGGMFHCDPYDRLLRALPRIFDGATSLEDDAFMTRLAAVCPELDGGECFRVANPTFDVSHRTCSLGLAQALLALHEDQHLILHCPRDSRGWSLAAAVPHDDGETLRSDRFSAVEWRSFSGVHS